MDNEVTSTNAPWLISQHKNINTLRIDEPLLLTELR